MVRTLVWGGGGAALGFLVDCLSAPLRGEWAPACHPGDDTPVRIAVNMVGVGFPKLGNRKWHHLLCEMS